ncbi:SGNH/GDSL hydrolase family protein [Neobacillus terrae]|uniref:SGNH/GDSL hydrolase family protein n=1 Tax=Neobacillus terrae TaxID=3034837 RepID=UPI001409DFF0|nr:SGNH/GDSL hydrolase family protein [Neobacillus terrae]NHM29306.1 SGNH/GDSL hydrolase family protein [Neobacillus terrae]
MLKRITCLFLSVFLLSSCSQPETWRRQPDKKINLHEYQSIPADFIPKPLTVVSAGDSLTEGIGGSSNKGGYLPYLKKRLENEKGIKGVHFYNYGVKGNRTTQLLKRLKTDEIRGNIKKADMVILTIGGNDIMKVVYDNLSNLQLSAFEKAKEKYITHLTQIVSFITQENPHASIVLIGLYNPFERWFADNKELEKVVTEWNGAGQMVVSSFPNTTFVQIEDLFSNTKENLLFTDHFHPNDRGYQLIAERTFDQLEVKALPAISKRYLAARKEEN